MSEVIQNSGGFIAYWNPSKRDIINMVDMIEKFANRHVGIDASLHHPDARARLHAAGMEVDTEIMKRMAKLNEGEINALRNDKNYL